MTNLYKLDDSNFEEYQSTLPDASHIENAIKGVMVGAAIGDAAGVPYEVFGQF